VVKETVQLMRQLWTEEEPEFEGRYVRVSRCRAYPKPAQRPHPPILLGARGTAKNFDRVARWADGWIPQAAGRRKIMNIFDPDLAPALSTLQHHWTAAGRVSAPPDHRAALPHADRQDRRCHRPGGGVGQRATLPWDSGPGRGRAAPAARRPGARCGASTRPTTAHRANGAAARPIRGAERWLRIRRSAVVAFSASQVAYGPPGGTSG
jgi:alkanesulfonate monooxygenase SsuD/methylene tetrahydromethanopterin reductase-like flavin-dependent oxidoreductase (luciferase family)